MQHDVDMTDTEAGQEHTGYRSRAGAYRVQVLNDRQGNISKDQEESRDQDADGPKRKDRNQIGSTPGSRMSHRKDKTSRHTCACMVPRI